jgi:drug/metabolite transporter (DMT)-like permease
MSEIRETRPARGGSVERMLHHRPVPWQVLFVLLGAIWGCSFLFIKLGLVALSPAGVAFVRLAVGAVTLLAISAVTRSPLPRRASTWRHLAVVALLWCSIPFTLFAYGETLVSSILAGMINAMTPLATLVVVLAAFPEERPTRQRILGLLIGFLGALVLLGVWEDVGGELAGVAACFGAIACYGLAFPYFRRNLSATGDTPLALATGQVGLGALFLLPLVAGLTLAGSPVVTAPPRVETIVGMLALGALGSGVAYVLNTRIVIVAGATTASSVTYITPLFAVAAGVLVLGEPVTWNEPVGGAIVLLGVAIAQGRIRLPEARLAQAQ